MIGTQAAYARHIDVSAAYVSKMVRLGKIPRRDDGQIDFAAADHARGVCVDPARTLVEPTPAPKKSRKTKDGDLTFTQARTEREIYQAKLSKLELDKQLRRVLSRRGVEDGLVAGARTVCEQLAALVNRADEIEAAARNGGVVAVRALLRSAVRDLQQSTSDVLTRAVQDVMANDTK